MQYLIEHKILVPLTDESMLKKGSIVRRINRQKDQQGVFVDRDDNGNLVLVNVIDMKNCQFAAEAGILKKNKNDTLYVFAGSFSNDAVSETARKIIHRWILYIKNPNLQKSMDVFVENSFAPEQVIDFDRTDNLKFVFVPIQQKFKIGRFKVNIDWDREREKRFGDNLQQLRKGEHMTYVACIPENATYRPLFYSIGTKPHESTVLSLRSEAFNFVPTNGGHIKCIEFNKRKEFLVDAGSNFLGKGVKSSLHTAKKITNALKRVYKEYDFTPVEGRGAFDNAQSY